MKDVFIGKADIVFGMVAMPFLCNGLLSGHKNLLKDLILANQGMDWSFVDETNSSLLFHLFVY